MKVLVTGGTGYVGFNLASLLCASNEISEVIAYDNLSRHNESVFFAPVQRPEKLKLVKADILDTRKLRRYMKDADVVIHLAARVTTPFANQDPHFFEQVNHWGTAETIYAAEECGINKYVYLSSTAVYGHSAEPVTELTSANPQTYYGISKLRGEEHVNRFGLNSNAIIVRCGNIYGYSPALRFDAVINNFILQANRENRLTIHGSGMQLRSFTHVEEVTEMLHQIILKDVPSGTYNFVKRTLRINEIADAIEQLFPGLERIYINQHIGLNSLAVSEQTELSKWINIPGRDFHQDLESFCKQFTFGYANR